MWKTVAFFMVAAIVIAGHAATSVGAVEGRPEGRPLRAPGADGDAIPDFSGHWKSSPDRLQVRRIVHRIPNGWDRYIEGVRSIKDYRIEIRQTSDEIAVAFPGGANNFLSVPAFTIGGSPKSTVENLGASWRKTTCRGWWDGGLLSLTATRQADRWADSDPATAKPQETDLISQHMLRLDTGRHELTMDTTVSDEKGEAQYQQVFRRAE